MRHLLRHRMRGFSVCFLATLVTLLLGARSSQAVLVLTSDDDTFWPGVAPVRTSSFEATNYGTRGTRGDRNQYQTFEVSEAFSLDKIYINYVWALTEANAVNFPWQDNPTKVTLYEITRTYNEALLEDTITLGNIVIPETSFVINGTDKVPEQRFAMELDWNPEVSGELILQPRTGNQGYALKINGTLSGQGSQAIGLIERGDNPYPFGRAYEFQGLGQTGPFTNRLFDFPMVITAVPDPAPDGDFNFDGIVDAADYVAWRKTNSGDPLAYEQWVENFGPSNGGGASAPDLGGNAVPEPIACVLLATVFIIFISPSRLLRRSK